MSYTVYRPQVYRVWQLQWYWLMDTLATNSYLVIIHGMEDIQHRAHRKYQEELTTQLLLVADDRLEQVVEQVVERPQLTRQWETLP